MAVIKTYPVIDLNYDPANPYGGWIFMVQGLTGAGGNLTCNAYIGNSPPSDFEKGIQVMVSPVGDQNPAAMQYVGTDASVTYNETTGILTIAAIGIDTTQFPLTDCKLNMWIYIPNWDRGVPGLNGEGFYAGGADTFELCFKR